ncbi:MAG: hypothetical protein RI922_2512 [Bacteroidota bacterium]|jgi:hypothetical protein
MRSVFNLKAIRIIRSFFPFLIILGQLKYNLISLFYWTLLFSIVSDSFGSAFGVPYLFFSPEYLGTVNPWSFLLLGFAFGGFTMAFNTYSYIKLGPRYQFLSTISKPFYRFCINNALIPIIFICYYLVKMIDFQKTEELASNSLLFVYSISFIGGFGGFILLSIFYFFPTTREKGAPLAIEESSRNPIQSMTQVKEKWYDYFRKEKERHFYYIGKGFKIYKSRPTHHLDKEIIEHVYAKNRINASIFELLSIATFVLLGFFVDFPLFEFPAAMSIILLLTIIHMLFSALMSWFHRWTYPIIFGVLIGMNYLSTHSSYFKYTNYAYGIDYSEKNLQKYGVKEIAENVKNEDLSGKSHANQIILLSNWKKQTESEKPKLIILNTSGGGSRSALWTFTVLQKCDKELNGQLSKHLNLITGASGGMVGAAYYREILLRYTNKEIVNRFDERFAENLGKDLLNKLAFSASTTDMFFRYRTFEYNGRTYSKDRGYAFEEQLHENTDNYLQHTLGYYAIPERKGQIPLMIFSPTIVNDGRRLLIASQSLSFLTESKEAWNSYENIDYQSFFKSNDPQNLRFSSVLRSSSTFPFIMPMITMPTSPEMQLMDAGIRDNYGRKTTVEYLFAMKDWIKKNTSGVIILEIRDTKRILNNEEFKHISFIDKLTLPFGNMYSNFPRTQDFDQEQLQKTASFGFPFPVDLVTFNLRENKKDRISLSWHLTKNEKLKIANAFYSTRNLQAFKRLKKLLYFIE